MIILGSVFYILKEMIKLRQIRVFAGELIKKIRYWTKYIPGDDIGKYFEDKEADNTDSLKGVLNNVP